MGRALMLNASFEPLCVVSARRAVVLVLKEKAEIVHRNGAEFRSERRAVPVPTGLLLLTVVMRPNAASEEKFRLGVPSCGCLVLANAGATSCSSRSTTRHIL